MCSSSLGNELTFAKNKLVWSPTAVPALDSAKLYFVMATLPTTTTTPSLPRIDFFDKPFSYTFGATVNLNESGSSVSSEQTQEVQTSTTPVVQNSTPPTPTNGALATGTVSRQIFNGILNYVLTTADGKNYSLYNNLKWRDIGDFTKGADKSKPIAVYGDFYVNRYGVTTGIKFTRFEVLN